MRLLFKILGLILIFSASAAVGFLKSRSLKSREKKLSRIARSLNSLAEYIRADKSEIEALAEKCFDRETVCFTDGKILFDKSFLQAEDIALLEELFLGFGTSDADGEYERTHMYAVLVEKQARLADEGCRRLCGLYNTLGVLCGIFICIFFI